MIKILSRLVSIKEIRLLIYVLSYFRKLSIMSLLKDPLGDRKIVDLPLPFCKSITKKELFDGPIVREQTLINFLEREGVLDQELVQ